MTLDRDCTVFIVGLTEVSSCELHLSDFLSLFFFFSSPCPSFNEITEGLPLGRRSRQKFCGASAGLLEPSHVAGSMLSRNGLNHWHPPHVGQSTYLPNSLDNLSKVRWYSEILPKFEFLNFFKFTEFYLNQNNNFETIKWKPKFFLKNAKLTDFDDTWQCQGLTGRQDGQVGDNEFHVGAERKYWIN